MHHKFGSTLLEGHSQPAAAFDVRQCISFLLTTLCSMFFPSRENVSLAKHIRPLLCTMRGVPGTIVTIWTEKNLFFAISSLA